MLSCVEELIMLDSSRHNCYRSVEKDQLTVSGNAVEDSGSNFQIDYYKTCILLSPCSLFGLVLHPHPGYTVNLRVMGKNMSS